MGQNFDINYVRSLFPAFSEKELAGKAFFENAGGSYTSSFVIDRLLRFYKSRKVQPYGYYPVSELAGAEMDEARSRLSEMMNIKSESLSFGPSTTQNTYVIAQAFSQTYKKGDAIIVTDQDHEANSGFWRRLEKFGYEIREWKLRPDNGTLEIEDLKKLLDGNVRLVSFPHCSNIVGSPNSAEEICRIIHEFGAFSCVDGVSYAPHGFPNLKKMGPDIYLFSSYKTYGPHLGLMYLSKKLRDYLPNQGHYFNSDNPALKFTPAGPDHAQIASAAGMADYVDALHKHHFSDDVKPYIRAERIHKLQRNYEREICAPLVDFLSSRNDIKLLGPRDNYKKVPTLALDVGERAVSIARGLAKFNVMAGAGDFYAVRTLKSLGVKSQNGVLRLSFVHYTTREEVGLLINSLQRVL